MKYEIKSLTSAAWLSSIRGLFCGLGCPADECNPLVYYKYRLIYD